jgi:NTE family protein
MSRIGLVLGAGGAVGHAYHSGVLAALEEAGWDPRSAEIIVGTSAGSVVAAYLRAGMSAGDLAAATRRRPLSAEGAALLARAGRGRSLETPGLQHADVAGGPAAADLLLRPWGVRLGTLAAAILPSGKVSTEPIAAQVRAVFGDAWPDRPTWICAVRLDDGRLVAFGKPGAPPATMAEAVSASCAIPAYFQPVVIGGRRHIDGGSHSVTNADLLAGLGLDLVVISCPMGGTRDAFAMGWDLPVRGAVRARLAAEVGAVRGTGTPVLTLQPTRPVRAAMGSNPMDGGRGPAVAEAAWRATRERLADADVRDRLAALA